MLKVLWMYISDLLFNILTLKFSTFCWNVSNLYDFLVKGYTKYEIMDLDDAFFSWFIPRIEYFRKHRSGVPAGTTEYKWDKTLSNMHKYAVESQKLLREGYYKDRKGGYHYWMESKAYKKFQYLFTKYLNDLWF